MNAVEIEESISALAGLPFDGGEFPYAFLQAFGNKETTIKRLRAGASNRSDLGGVLQTGNIHIAVAPQGEVGKRLAALKASPATAKAKARYILATDGTDFEAEDFDTGDTVACAYADFPDHFGFFLPLAGITTVKQVRESSFDIRATSRLNRLYVQLLKDNPDWEVRRHDMNHFMARLVFCFFAEDTDIFSGTGMFSATVDQMSARDASNVHEVIGEIFRAMNIRIEDRAAAKLRPWADAFPYVNGELFSGSLDVPRFSKIARSFLLHIGNLEWTKINPDIFGSMIQAVAEDEERGALGMHYTSVPNILKVLNPLFLDDLRARTRGKRWYAVCTEAMESVAVQQAIAYYRVSTARQGRSGLGIDAQRVAVTHFAEVEGFELAAEFVEAESGKGADALDRRPQLAAALAAGRAGKCPVIVAKLDRDLRGVAQAMNDRGVRTTRGGRCHVSNVKNLLDRANRQGLL